MKWISVNDQKPQGKCLVMLKEELCGNKIHSAVFAEAYTTISTVFSWDAPEVTHWADLPKEPNEIKE